MNHYNNETSVFAPMNQNGNTLSPQEKVFKNDSLRNLISAYNDLSNALTPPSAPLSEWVEILSLEWVKVEGEMIMRLKCREMSKSKGEKKSMNLDCQTELHLENCVVTDKLLNSIFSSAIHLTTLTLSNFNRNTISLKSFQMMQNLQHLKLNKVPLSEINETTGLPSSLEEISIENCNLSIIPRCIFTLKNLKRLSVKGNAIKELPQELLELTNLEYLNLDENIVAIDVPIPNFSELKKLDELILPQTIMANTKVHSSSSCSEVKRFLMLPNTLTKISGSANYFFYTMNNFFHLDLLTSIRLRYDGEYFASIMKSFFFNGPDKTRKAHLSPYESTH